MTDATYIVSLLAAAALGGLLGWLGAMLRSQKKIAQLSTMLDMEQRAAAEKLADLKKNFIALSSEALKNNNQAFLLLAQESLKQFHVQAKGDLEQKEKAVEK